METSPSRPGQVNLANDVNALFLKQFAGEVLTTFETENVMMPLHTVRSISSGKSAQFPTTGIATAAYHTPGESLMTTDNAGGGASKYLSRLRHAEVVISIDDMLVSSAFIANIDEAKNHYDVRSIYSTEIGRALAYIADRNLIRTVIAGALATTDRFGNTGTTAAPYLGDTITWDNEIAAASLPDEIVKPFFTAAQKMDEKNVPQNDRYAVVTPDFYYKLVNVNKDVISRDFNPEGNGSKAGGYIVQVAGIRILKSNNIPTTDEAATAIAPHGDAGIQNDPFGTGGTGYRRTTDNGFLRSSGIIFQKEAIGTVKLLDLGVESDYSIERQGTLMVAKYAMGHGVLRNECCFWLREDASA
jgi:hypothetical protein